MAIEDRKSHNHLDLDFICLNALMKPLLGLLFKRFAKHEDGSEPSLYLFSENSGEKVDYTFSWQEFRYFNSEALISQRGTIQQIL